MTVQLCIDVRERDLIQFLQGKVPFVQEALDIGDVLFRNEEDGELVFVVERKTVLDLKASIIDSRRKEQKERLKTVQRDRILYLIEGDLNFPLEDKISSFPISTLVSSILNTQLRDKIWIYKTLALEETGELIRALLAKLNKDGHTLFQPEAAPPEGLEASARYCSTLNKCKKANLTPEVWFIQLLSQVPQVTEKVAVEIVKIYPTLRHLMRGYDSNTKMSLMLADIKFPIKGGKTRRIGDKLSARIYEFVHG